MEIGTKYEKIMTDFITDNIPLEYIKFDNYEFIKAKTESQLTIDELEIFGIFDPNRYKKKSLLKMEIN